MEDVHLYVYTNICLTNTLSDTVERGQKIRDAAKKSNFKSLDYNKVVGMDIAMDKLSAEIRLFQLNNSNTPNSVQYKFRF